MGLTFHRGVAALISRVCEGGDAGPRQRAEELRKMVTNSASPSSIPQESIDGIIHFWLERLQFECLRLFLEREGGGTPNVVSLRGAIEDACGELKLAFAQLPCPEPAARRLGIISERLFLEGSPLFGWWEPLSDRERLADLSSKAEAGALPPPSWDVAPPVVQQWDLAVIKERARGLGATGLDLEDNKAALLPFVAHLSQRQKHSVQALFPSGVVFPESMAAESEGVRATAHFPFTVTVPKTARLVLRSKGLNKGIWHIEAQLEEVLSRAQTQGKALDRLTVRDPRTYQHIASAASVDMKTRTRWEIGVPLRALSGIWLVEKLPDPRQQEAVLSELLSKVPDDLFLWVLGEAEGG
jgi:hypothetical protein